MSVTKLLIANRGEIAIRIARAAADMSWPTVARVPRGFESPSRNYRKLK